MPWPRPVGVLALAVVLALVGGTFVLQGLGVPIGHSFMIGDLRWTAIGAVLVVVAAGLAWRGVRPPS